MRTCFSADCACCHLECQDRLALAEATVKASLSAAVQAPAGWNATANVFKSCTT